jgi:heme exporter protein CcmD
MTHAGYVAAAYLAVFGSIAAYAAWTLVRGRRLSRQVAPEDRRWL